MKVAIANVKGWKLSSKQLSKQYISPNEIKHADPGKMLAGTEEL